MKIKNFTNSKLKITKKVIFIMMFTFASLNSFSQTSTFISMSEYLAQQRASSRTNIQNTTELEKLVFNKQNAVYISNNNFNVYGDNPTIVFTSVNNLSRLFTENFNKNNIKVINLKVNSISELSNIDLSNLSSFPNLKYIFFTCKIPVRSNNFNQINTGNQSKIEFIYYYENPS